MAPGCAMEPKDHDILMNDCKVVPVAILREHFEFLVHHVGMGADMLGTSAWCNIDCPYCDRLRRVADILLEEMR